MGTDVQLHRSSNRATRGECTDINAAPSLCRVLVRKIVEELVDGNDFRQKSDGLQGGEF